MSKAILALCLPIAFGAGLLLGTQAPLTSAPPKPEPSFSFILMAPSGDEYVIDHNLSRGDCMAAKEAMQTPDPEAPAFFCEKEA